MALKPPETDQLIPGAPVFVEGYIDPHHVETIESLISPKGAEGRERKKWNSPKRQGGFKCDGYEEFPRMLYKARELPNGQLATACTDDAMFLGPTVPVGTEAGQAERWTAGCQIIVKDEIELHRYLEQGYRKTSQEAMEAAEDRKEAISRAAAERHASDRRMSGKAQEEAKEADRASFHHLPEITEKPRRKYSRKPKPSAEA